MKAFLARFLVFAALLPCAQLRSAPVLMISIDGMRPDASPTRRSTA
jgi:hypothetical protein